MRRGAARTSAAPKHDDAERIVRSRLRLFGVLVLCAKVALLPVVFDYSLDVPFTIAKTLLSHGLAYVLAGVIAGLLLQFGRSFVVWSPLHLPVLAFLAANLAATIFAADRVLALYGAHVRMLGLGTIADWVVLYFGIALLVRSRTEVLALIASALAASVVVLGYELVQLLGSDPFSWDVDVVARPISTIGQATSLAQYLTILAIGAIGLGFLGQNIHRGGRALLVAVAALFLAGAGATGTRSALLGIAAGSALLVVLIWIHHPSRRARLLALGVAVAASVSLAALLLLTPLGARFAAAVSPPADADESVFARLEPTAEARLALYEIAAAMVRERPVLGFGPDNFAVGVARFRTESEPLEVRQSLATSAHSWVAYIATSGGLLGLAAFVAIAVMGLGLTFRGGFRPLTIVAAAMLVAFLGTGLTTINDISTDWLFWVAAGTIAASTARASSASNGQLHGKRREAARVRRETGLNARRAVAVLFVAVGLALSLTAVSAWEASRSNRSSQSARLVGRSAEAIERSLHATRRDSGRAEYWHGLGLAYISAARWADASAAFEIATRLAPYDVRSIGDDARAQLLLAGGRSDVPARARAIELSDQAVRIDPNNPRAQLSRAVVMQATGNLPEAIRSVDRALALDPRSTSALLYVTATQIYLDSRRPGDAVRVARDGVAAIGPIPASVPVRYELARALVASGQPRDALAELDVALAIQPNSTSVQRLRAEIAASLVR